VKLVLFSLDDVAGNNITRIMSEKYGFTDSGESFNGQPILSKDDILLVGSKTTVRELEDTMNLHPEVCIVASRHKSESGQPTLTCHATGNYGNAEMGGNSKHLQLTNALYLRKALLLLLKKQREHNLPYDVSLEVTHHGPTELPFPLLYVEVGSGEKQWNDLQACAAVAEVIRTLCDSEPEFAPTAIGFGGPHYAPNFTRIVGKTALGHIASKHVLDLVDGAMIQQMVEKTVPKPEYAVLDWKGFKSEDRNMIIRLLEDNGLEYRKTSELKGD